MSSSSPTPKSGHSLVEYSTVFHTPEPQRLLEYWLEKRGERPRPRLSDFDLMALYKVAPVLTIRDLVNGGTDFRCRYWGTRLVDIFGVEPTGKLLSESFNPESADILRDRLHMALAADGALRVVTIVRLVDVTVPRTYEGIWLPLDGDQDERQHTIGAFGFDYQIQDGELKRDGGPDDWRRISYPTAPTA